MPSDSKPANLRNGSATYGTSAATAALQNPPKWTFPDEVIDFRAESRGDLWSARASESKGY